MKFQSPFLFQKEYNQDIQEERCSSNVPVVTQRAKFLKKNVIAIKLRSYTQHYGNCGKNLIVIMAFFTRNEIILHDALPICSQK